ncbi:hypothetical protein AKO1_000988 [Acrasis kona]|uniref:Uncharacterized protein n=1 Tax=Acrasis kona TaxID=1008807 RepID=A0AAW2ZB66_9EUKA
MLVLDSGFELGDKYVVEDTRNNTLMQWSAVLHELQSLGDVDRSELKLFINMTNTRRDLERCFALLLFEFSVNQELDLDPIFTDDFVVHTEKNECTILSDGEIVFAKRDGGTNPTVLEPLTTELLFKIQVISPQLNSSKTSLIRTPSATSRHSMTPKVTGERTVSHQPPPPKQPSPILEVTKKIIFDDVCEANNSVTDEPEVQERPIKKRKKTPLLDALDHLRKNFNTRTGKLLKGESKVAKELVDKLTHDERISYSMEQKRLMTLHQPEVETSKKGPPVVRRAKLTLKSRNHDDSFEL